MVLQKNDEKQHEIPKKKRKLKRRERNHNRRAARKESTETKKKPLEFPSSASEADRNSLLDQLGYVPSNLIRVCASDGVSEQPLVCMLYPLTVPACERRRNGRNHDMEPFPTTFWLVCPELKIRISSLEDNRWVSKLEERLSQSPQAQAQMKLAHETYANFRWDLIEEKHQIYIETRGWTSALKDVGIAGMRNYSKIKCLHTMYAYWLVLKNDAECPECMKTVSLPVGDWIHELLRTNT